MANATTFYFYDLETTGFNPREARIMQFAGQRTDMNLQPIGEPHNYLIKLSDDVVPEPDAVLVTGITPQKTLAEGITEAEFLRIFHEQIIKPETIFTGFNTIRFDDEFMRYLHYRNYYDPYEWQYQDGRSRWDLLDLLRITRALRPEGIEWPVDAKGSPTNRLELFTKLNGLEHESAHDALSDVHASIAVARLVRNKQPKLFDFSLSMRDKQKVAALVGAGRPFIYTSGKYASEFEKTTMVGLLADHPEHSSSALVFDLRYDPEPFIGLSPSALAEAWTKRKDEPGPRLPVKTLKYNRCPAIAPLSVLDNASQERLKLFPKTYDANFKKLESVRAELRDNVFEAMKLLDVRKQAQLLEDEAEVDTRMYDEFFSRQDKTKMSLVRAAGPEELEKLDITFKDSRLTALLPLYKARNFPNALTDEERGIWERFRERKLIGGGDKSRLARYFGRLSQLESSPDVTPEQKYLIEELKLYGQSIMPAEEA
ncbi:exodeoxyribonuclease I [soil metagenome]